MTRHEAGTDLAAIMNINVSEDPNERQRKFLKQENRKFEKTIRNG